MSRILTSGNYVKFVRTTAAVWTNVPVAEKDSDTLYFVLSQDRTSGDLYLGSTLITGNVNSNLSLGDLTDVLNANNITDGSVLSWNDTNSQWEPLSLFDLVTSITSSIAVMTGATASTDGAKGLVPVPQAGQQNWMLTGNGQWTNPTPVIQQVINTNAADWFGADWDSQSSAPANSQTVRNIAADEVAKIVANAPASLDTLKEIADWIGKQPDTATFINRITYLEDRVLNGVAADPETGDPAIPSLIYQVSTLNNNYTSMDTRVTNVENSLKWQDMSEQS